MSSWHEIGQVPAFAARSLSRLHVESSSLAPQTCVNAGGVGGAPRHYTNLQRDTESHGAVQEELDGLVAMLVPERVSVSGLGEGALPNPHITATY